MAYGNPRLRLLYLKDILITESDEDNPLSTQDLLKRLSTLGIETNRKTIYSDIALLQEYGINIIAEKKWKNNYYFVSERDFELPELKLLVDAVESSRFISQKKSHNLVKKLSSLTSKGQAKNLGRNVFISDRIKTVNEVVYYSIDTIHNAIIQNHKILFKYFKLNIKGRKLYHRNGEIYSLYPYAMTWSNDNYYVIGYCPLHSNDISHFRIDRMANVRIDENNQLHIQEKTPFNVAEYVRKIFDMYGGKIVTVILQFHNDLLCVVYDRFGKDINLQENFDGTFNVITDISISPTSIGWILQFGDKVKVISPEELIVEICNVAKNHTAQYL